jgi:hypothetical protein
MLVDCFKSGEILFVQDVEEMLKGYYQVRRRALGYHVVGVSDATPVSPG